MFLTRCEFAVVVPDIPQIPMIREQFPLLTRARSKPRNRTCERVSSSCTHPSVRACVLNPLVVNQAHSLRNLCDAKTAFWRRAGWTDERIFSTSSSASAAAGSRRPQRRQNHEAMNKDRPPPPPFGSFFPPQRTDIPQEARTHALKGGTFALQRGSQTSPVILATTHSSSQNGKRSRKLPKDSDTVVF